MSIVMFTDCRLFSLPIRPFSRSAEPAVIQTLVRSAEPVVTHNHQKNVRFGINNDNDDRNNNDDDDCAVIITVLV